MLGIQGNAGHRTNLHALGLVKVADAFRALGRIDFINLRAEIDRLIRALRLAHIAVDAFVGDHQRHATGSAKVRIGFMVRIIRERAQTIGV